MRENKKSAPIMAATITRAEEKSPGKNSFLLSDYIVKTKENANKKVALNNV